MSNTWKIVVAFGIGMVVGSVGLTHVLHSIGQFLQGIHP